MAEYLHTTIDKFTFRVATDRHYSTDGIWLQDLGDGRVRVGVTDEASILHNFFWHLH